MVASPAGASLRLHLLLSVALEMKAKSNNLQDKGCVCVRVHAYAYMHRDIHTNVCIYQYICFNSVIILILDTGFPHTAYST